MLRVFFFLLLLLLLLAEPVARLVFSGELALGEDLNSDTGRFLLFNDKDDELVVDITLLLLLIFVVAGFVTTEADALSNVSFLPSLVSTTSFFFFFFAPSGGTGS